MEEIELLSEILEFYLKNWEIDPKQREPNWSEQANITQEQKEHWPQDERLTHRQFSNNNAKRIMIGNSYGFDKLEDESVCNRKENAVIHYWWDNENKSWPTADSLVRFGVFMHLDIFTILLMLFKKQWEKHFKNQIYINVNNWGIDETKTLNDNLKNWGYAQNCTHKFDLGLNSTVTAEEIYGLFEHYGKLPDNIDYNQEKLNSLIWDFRTNQIFLFALNSEEFKLFKNNQQKHLAELNLVSVEIQERFWCKKFRFLELFQEFEDKIIFLEEIRLSNTKIEKDWLATFGELFFIILRLTNEIDICLLKDELKEEKLTEEELEIIILEKQIEKQKELEELRIDIELSKIFISPENFRTFTDNEMIVYKRETKTILSKIWKKTHPDIADTLNFTETQIEKLRDYFDKSMTIKHSDIDLQTCTIEKHRLEEILEKINELYELMGLELPEETFIQGETLEEQINWLDRKINKTERDLTVVQNEITAQAGNIDIKEKEQSLSSKEQIEQYLSEMKKKIIELEEELNKYKDDSLSNETDSKDNYDNNSDKMNNDDVS